MASPVATDSVDVSGRITALGSSPTPARAASAGPVSAVSPVADPVARARRRLVDALMDAARLRALQAEDVKTGGTGRRVPDFVGLALGLVTSCTRREASRPSGDCAVPSTPALDMISVLLTVLSDGGVPPAASTLRVGVPAMQRDLERLCRLAAVTDAMAQAVVATAPDMAALLAEAAARRADRPSPHGRALSFTVSEAGLTGTRVGPGAENRGEAVLLARLFLRRIHDLEAGRKPIPIYPAADQGLYRSIARWRAGELPPPLRRPVVHWDAPAVRLATLSVGSADWTALRNRAGFDGLRLRVMSGTALVLVDRTLGTARERVRSELWAVARGGGGALAPDACTALMASALAFHGATGQVLVCRRLEGTLLEIGPDVDWIDPLGRQRSDADPIAALADVAPLASLRLLDAARIALAEQRAGWRLIGGTGLGRGRRLALALPPGMILPPGG